MSKRTRYFSSPKTSFAIVFAIKVFPQPVPPMQRKLPIGLLSGASPILLLLMIRHIFSIASSCPITIRLTESSIDFKIFFSDRVILAVGIPDIFDTVLKISSSVITAFSNSFACFARAVRLSSILLSKSSILFLPYSFFTFFSSSDSSFLIGLRVLNIAIFFEAPVSSIRFIADIGKHLSFRYREAKAVNVTAKSFGYFTL